MSSENLDLPIKQKFEDAHDSCPKCGSSIIGEPIPEESRHHFGKATHFSRWIGIQDFRNDRLSVIECPDCGAQWPAY